MQKQRPKIGKQIYLQSILDNNIAGAQRNQLDIQQAELVYDELSAWEYLLAQEAIGFRYPGTAEHLETQDYIENHFSELYGWTFTKQTFEYNGVNLSNLIAEKEGETRSGLLVKATLEYISNHALH